MSDTSRILSKVVSKQLPDKVILLRHLAAETDFALRQIHVKEYTVNMELSDGARFLFNADPNTARQDGVTGAGLLFDARAGTRFLQYFPTENRVQPWIKISGDAGGRWEQDAFVSDIVAAARQGIFTLSFSWGDIQAQPLFLGTLLAGSVVTDVRIEIQQAFNGLATCGVGDTANGHRFMAEAESRMAVTAVWAVTQYKTITQDTNVYLTLSGTPTQGLGTVFITCLMRL